MNVYYSDSGSYLDHSIPIIWSDTIPDAINWKLCINPRSVFLVLKCCITLMSVRTFFEKASQKCLES